MIYQKYILKVYVKRYTDIILLIEDFINILKEASFLQFWLYILIIYFFKEQLSS